MSADQTKTPDPGSLQPVCSVPRALLSNVLDALYDLRGEWNWKKDEPRAGNQRQYESLCGDILGLENIVKSPNEKLTDRRPSEAPELPADVAGGGSVKRLVRCFVWTFQ